MKVIEKPNFHCMDYTGLSYKNLFRPELGILHHKGDRKVVILVLIQVQPTTKVTKYETFF